CQPFLNSASDLVHNLMSGLHLIYQPNNRACVCCRPTLLAPSIFSCLDRLIVQLFILLKAHATLMIPPARINQASRIKRARPIHCAPKMIVELGSYGSLPTIGRAHNMTLVSGINAGFSRCKEPSSHYHTRCTERQGCCGSAGV